MRSLSSSSLFRISSKRANQQRQRTRIYVQFQKAWAKSLKAEHALKHTDDQITKMITNGEEEMPAFKDKMSAQEIQQMVRYVRKGIQGK